MSDSFRFEVPEHFTAGTVGPRGQRTFFIQFGNVGEIVSLRLEKQQVYALAEFLEQLLDDAGPVAPDDVPLALDLIDPVQSAWTVSSIGVAYREEDHRFLLVVEELLDDDDDDDEQDDDDDFDDDEPASAQLSVSAGQVKAFIERARDLVSAGRPPCNFCGRPLDGDGLWCPCHN